MLALSLPPHVLVTLAPTPTRCAQGYWSNPEDADDYPIEHMPVAVVSLRYHYGTERVEAKT